MDNCIDNDDMHQISSSISPSLVETGYTSPIDIPRGANSAANTTGEEEQVKCECCGLGEECTPAYIAHVRDMYCGKWVCGLCAEAVKEEHERGSDDGSMKDALDAHMRICMQFNKPEKKERQVVDLAAAMTRLLRKSMDGSSSLRSAPSSPRRGNISRASSCLSTFPARHRYEAPL